MAVLGGQGVAVLGAQGVAVLGAQGVAGLGGQGVVPSLGPGVVGVGVGLKGVASQPVAWKMVEQERLAPREPTAVEVGVASAPIKVGVAQQLAASEVGVASAQVEVGVAA